MQLFATTSKGIFLADSRPLDAAIWSVADSDGTAFGDAFRRGDASREHARDCSEPDVSGAEHPFRDGGTGDPLLRRGGWLSSGRGFSRSPSSARSCLAWRWHDSARLSAPWHEWAENPRASWHNGAQPVGVDEPSLLARLSEGDRGGRVGQLRRSLKLRRPFPSAHYRSRQGPRDHRSSQAPSTARRRQPFSWCRARPCQSVSLAVDPP